MIWCRWLSFWIANLWCACWQIEHLERLVRESQQSVDTATSEAHRLKHAVNSVTAELEAVRSQLSSVNMQHTSLQVVHNSLKDFIVCITWHDSLSTFDVTVLWLESGSSRLSCCILLAAVWEAAFISQSHNRYCSYSSVTGMLLGVGLTSLEIIYFITAQLVFTTDSRHLVVVNILWPFTTSVMFKLVLCMLV